MMSILSIILLCLSLLLFLLLIVKSVELSKENDESVKQIYKSQVITFTLLTVLLVSLFIYVHVFNNSKKVEDLILLISNKTNLEPLSLCLLSLFFILFISLIIDSVKLSKENNQTAKIIYRNNVIALSIFSMLSLAGFVYMQFQNSQKSIAYKLLALSSQPKTEKTLEVASNLCDKLFNKSEKGIRDQFFDMKQKRPIEETRNMCFNYARSLTGQ